MRATARAGKAHERNLIGSYCVWCKLRLGLMVVGVDCVATSAQGAEAVSLSRRHRAEPVPPAGVGPGRILPGPTHRPVQEVRPGAQSQSAADKSVCDRPKSDAFLQALCLLVRLQTQLSVGWEVGLG